MYKNIPNYLTIARLIAIPVIIISFYFDDSKFAHRLGAVIFALACLTDFLDGFLARRFSLVSHFGTMFDPIADKVLVGCVLLMLVKFHRTNEIACMLILSRELIVAGFREFLAQIKVSVPVTRLAKIKTCIQMLAMTILLLGSTGSGITHLDAIGTILLWISAILTLITGYSYLKASLKYI